MVCMQPVLYQTGESFFWIGLRPECLARPTTLAENSVGLQFAKFDSTLNWGQNWSACIDSTAFKPHKSSYKNTVTMTTLWDLYPLNFCVLPCYVRSLVAQNGACNQKKHTHTHKLINRAPVIHSTCSDSVTRAPIIASEKEYCMF